jgi:hypothetical protein
MLKAQSAHKAKHEIHLRIVPDLRDERTLTPQELLKLVVEDEDLVNAREIKRRKDAFNLQLQRILNADPEVRSALAKIWNGTSRTKLHQLLDQLACLLECNAVIPWLSEKNLRDLSAAQIGGWTGGKSLGKCWTRYQVIWQDCDHGWITDKHMALKLEDEAILLHEIMRSRFGTSQDDIRRLLLFQEVQTRIRRSGGRLRMMIDWEPIDRTVKLMRRQALERHQTRQRHDREEMARARHACEQEEENDSAVD